MHGSKGGLGFATELVYITTVEFEWDGKKAKANLQKHRISFLEASTALRDPLATTGRDPDHSDDEERWITFGMSSQGRLLVVAHTERGERIRIISARLATKREQNIFEET